MQWAHLPEFVWGLVAKGEENSIREEQWDHVSQRSLFFSYTATDGAGAFLKRT